MKFLKEYRFLRNSILTGYSLVAIGLALSIVLDSLVYLLLVALILSIRYAMFPMSPTLKRELPIWASFQNIEKVINRRASNRFRFFGGFWVSLALGVLSVVVKGTLISFFLLLKETELFFRFHKKLK